MARVEESFAGLFRAAAFARSFEQAHRTALLALEGGAAVEEAKLVGLQEALKDALAQQRRQAAEGGGGAAAQRALARSAPYRRFKEAIWYVTHEESHAAPRLHAAAESDDDDNDVVIEAASCASTRCPITQQLMVDPTYNSACGHFYSRTAILETLRSAPNCPCPVSGCQRPVVRALLLTDAVMSRRVARKALQAPLFPR